MKQVLVLVLVFFLLPGAFAFDVDIDDTFISNDSVRFIVNLSDIDPAIVQYAIRRNAGIIEQGFIPTGTERHVLEAPLISYGDRYEAEVRARLKNGTILSAEVRYAHEEQVIPEPPSPGATPIPYIIISILIVLLPFAFVFFHHRAESHRIHRAARASGPVSAEPITFSPRMGGPPLREHTPRNDGRTTAPVGSYAAKRRSEHDSFKDWFDRSF